MIFVKIIALSIFILSAATPVQAEERHSEEQSQKLHMLSQCTQLSMPKIAIDNCLKIIRADLGTWSAVVPFLAEAYLHDHQYDDAIEDFSILLEKVPTDKMSIFGRGRAYFARGDFTAAAKDFKDYIRLESDSPRAMLWLFLAQSRAGIDGLSELKSNIDTIKKRKFMIFPAYLFTGKLSAQQIYQMGKLGGRGHVDQIYFWFYLGQHQLILGDTKTAIELFQAVVDAGKKVDFSVSEESSLSIEYFGALAELKRLNSL